MTLQRLPNRSADVDRFLAALRHPMAGEIEAIRDIILDCNGEITEHIKWNAPSYRHRGEDRVTFRLHPRDRIHLVFHRGAKKRSDDFAFDDPTGLLVWAAADRATLAFAGMADVEDRREKLATLVRAWIASTDRGGG